MPKEKREGPIQARLMGVLAAMFFAIPTTVILWLGINRELALWGAPDAYIGSSGFWLIMAAFFSVAMIFPHLFPAMLGKAWIFITYWF